MKINDNRENITYLKVQEIIDIILTDKNIKKINIYNDYIYLENEKTDDIFISFNNSNINSLKYYEKELIKLKEKIKYLKLINKKNNIISYE